MERHLADLFGKTSVGLCWIDAAGRVLWANPAQADLLGCPRAQCVGRPLAEFFSDRPVAEDFLRRLRAHESVSAFRVRLRQSNGGLRHALMDAHGRWKRGRFERALCFSRDITPRADLEREMLEISEREQRRIGQDLHDGLGQHLVGAAYLTHILHKRLVRRRAPEAEEAGRLVQLLEEAVEQTRGLARGLHPLRADPLGLREALRELAGRLRVLFRVPCRFDGRQTVRVENLTVATHLYRVAQEATTNAVRHGRARHVVLALQETAEVVRLVVRDDGAGIRRPQSGAGLGLRIMEHRAELIGGSLLVRRRRQRGTEVICTVPAALAATPTPP